MSNLDLQESTRRDDNYQVINKLIDDLQQVDVFPSLVWLWCWDVIRNWYENEQWDDVHEDGHVDECFAQGLELKTIWDKFWEDSDKNGFTLEFGVEDLDESLRDWLRDNDFLVSLDEDGWLDE
jgi:hypothetical protein